MVVVGLIDQLGYRIPEANRLQRLVWKVSSSRPGACLFAESLHHIDRRENLYTTGAADDELLADRRTLLPVLIAYAVVILVGLALPTVAVVLYLAVAVFLVGPYQEIRRMFSRQSN